MARKGRFGRLPRSAPDLTATIVSILREYQSQRDRNIQDAWEEGGVFEGKKVTDEMVLDHWKKRRDEVDPSDPLYDTYNQAVGNLEFKISNSKQELGYAEKKFNDIQMAGFYRGWAGKYPVNSEAWRRMMTLAAQYTERAKASRGGGGGGGSAKAKAYAAAVGQAYRKEVPFNALTDIFTGIAKNTGILNKDNDDLFNLNAKEGIGDSTQLLEVIEKFNTDPAYQAARDFYTNYIQKNGDPHFNGQFTYATWLAYRDMKFSGINQRISLAQAAGRKGDFDGATKDMSKATAFSVRVGLIDDTKVYEEGRRKWDLIMTDPTSTPMQKWQATQEWHETLGSLVAHARQERGFQGKAGQLDPTVGSTAEGHLFNEWQATAGIRNGGPTLWDDSTGKVAKVDEFGKLPASDSEGTADTVNDLYTDLGNLTKTTVDPRTGQVTGAFVLTRVDGNNQPSTNATDPLKPVPVAALEAGTGYVPWGTAGGVTIPNPLGGSTSFSTANIMTAITRQPIKAVGIVKDANGYDVGTVGPKEGTSPIVGFVLVMPDGSKVYSYVDAKGVEHKANLSPFTSEPTSDGQGGWLVDVPLAPGSTELDITAAYADDYLNRPDSLPQSVHTGTLTAWMTGGATGTKALVNLTADAFRAAARHEAHGDPVKYGQMVAEADDFRADYINDTPMEQAQIRAAARRGIVGASIYGPTGSAIGPKEQRAIAALVQQTRLGEVPEDRLQSMAGALIVGPQHIGREDIGAERRRAADLLGPTQTASGLPVADARLLTRVRGDIYKMDPAQLRAYMQNKTGEAFQALLSSPRRTGGGYTPAPGKPEVPFVPAKTYPSFGAQLAQKLNPVGGFGPAGTPRTATPAYKPTTPTAPVVVQTGQEEGAIGYKQVNAPKTPGYGGDFRIGGR